MNATIGKANTPTKRETPPLRLKPNAQYHLIAPRTSNHRHDSGHFAPLKRGGKSAIFKPILGRLKESNQPIFVRAIMWHERDSTALF